MREAFRKQSCDNRQPMQRVIGSIVEVESGAQGRNRTTDTVIFSHVLYQLSYLGAGRAVSGRSAKARAL